MSSISSLAASLTSAIEKEAKELECTRAQLVKEKEQFDEEKRRMCDFAASANDIVKINVGGKVFQTQRSTLLSAEGTLLEAIFSGRWEDSLARDDMGVVFFDFDPAPFRLLLNYLRTRSLAEPGQVVALPQVPQEHQAQFETMVSFMGLKETVYGKTTTPEEAMACRQAGCRDNSITAVGGRLQSTVNDHRCAVGDAPLLSSAAQQKCAWKVSILDLPSWVLIGITGNPAPPDNSHKDVSTHGWASGAAKWAGGAAVEASGWPGWQMGDVAIFQLDARQQMLRCHLQRTGLVYTLPLPGGLVRSARMLFSTHTAGTVVEISQVSTQELTEVGF